MKVSIIILIYNIEKFLFKCINSAVIQTYKNIEILLVNDGSTDKSLDICNDFSYKDDRINLDASIDGRFTGVGNVNNDPGRFGLTIRRKVIGTTSQGKNIYKDTNNSKNDFVFGSESSLKQGIVH